MNIMEAILTVKLYDLFFSEKMKHYLSTEVSPLESVNRSKIRLLLDIKIKNEHKYMKKYVNINIDMSMSRENNKNKIKNKKDK